MSAQSEGLRIGRVRGVTTTKWSRIWAERHAEPLTIRDVEESEQLTGVRNGSLDMCFVRLPIDREGLHAIPLYEEQMVAWVSKDHPICAVEEITMADLKDEQVVTTPDPAATDLVLGGAVLVVPMSFARTASRRDLQYRPIIDAEPSPIALTWRVGDENPLIEEFIGVVRGRTRNSSRAAVTAETGRPKAAAGRAERTVESNARRVTPQRSASAAGRRGSRRRSR